MRDAYEENQYGYIFNLLKRTVPDTYIKQKNVAKRLHVSESAFSKHLYEDIGEWTIAELKEIAGYFNIPLIQAITGENPHYKQITDTYGLKTNALEWLKNRRSDKEIDYIGILNIILENKEIADLLVSTFYTYANVEITHLNKQSLEYESTENIKKALKLVADKNKTNRIKHTEQQLELALKDLKLFSAKADEELQRIEDEKRQDIEDFDKEAQEYYK